MTAADRDGGDARAPQGQGSDPLALPPRVLAGVGPARAAGLARAGLESVGDLLRLLPERLESNGELLPIAAARTAAGRVVRVRGTVKRVSLARRGRSRSTFTARIEDGSGWIDARWFQMPWMRERVRLGHEVELAGCVVRRREVTLVAPRLGGPQGDLGEPGTWRPVYPRCEGVGPERMRALVREAAARFADELTEPLAASVLARADLPSLAEAARSLPDAADPEVYRRARRRILLEALLAMQARHLQRTRDPERGRARASRIEDVQELGLRSCFPFEFTAGQRRIADELRADLARSVPMRRLLQGDVGSGKTALGLYAALIAGAGGAQTAFLAPTELLAEQHFAVSRALLEAAGRRTALLTGSLAAAERRRVSAELARGAVDVVFGTHALFSSDVRYARLGLAVIDEQQRFGVVQRARLLEKGGDVHALLMTATPIPRTLALTLYGDLDTSILRERPPGRGPLTTRWLRRQDGPRVPELLRERLEAGERVYWVAPRIGLDGEEELDSAALRGEEKQSAASAERAYARLAQSELARFGIELVHGRLEGAERARRLERFRRGEVGILVATTVIEVGVDVPEATVLVVEGAERLGLAQLHQLRGRVGRSPRPSWCLLYGAPEAARRLALLETCDDGFEIAEQDLVLRGMGELAGLRQAGAAGGLDPAGDVDLVLLARDLVREDAGLAVHYLARTPRVPASAAP